MGSEVDRLLADARSRIARVTPRDALAAQSEGALLIDIRTEEQRRATGAPPGSLAIAPTVLHWRLDATSEWRIPEAGARPPIVVLCQQGYSSTLAVWSLGLVGIPDARDVVGGFDAWLADGLPTADELPPRIP